MVASLRGLASDLFSFSFSPGGRLLATGYGKPGHKSGTVREGAG
jgi:hypothetical protein